MFTFLWLCIATILGYLGGDHWMNAPWIGACIGFVIGFALWAAVRLNSGDSVGELFDSIGDGFSSDSFGDGGGFGD